MKIPNLFGRTPKHQRFTFAPRYYDEKKEEMEERKARIIEELEADKKTQDGAHRSRIAGSFKSAKKGSQATPGDLNSALVRLGILLFMVLIIMAYLQWGNKALYGILIIIPFYAYLRLRK